MTSPQLITRRHALSGLSGAAALALAGCSSGQSGKTASPSRSTSTASIKPLARTVPGYSTHPTWSSRATPALASMTALDASAPVGHGGRVWMLFTHGSDLTIAAVDAAHTRQAPATGRVPGVSTAVLIPLTGSGPWQGLLLQVTTDPAGTYRKVTLSADGKRVSVSAPCAPPPQSGQNPQVRWMGDVLVAVADNRLDTDPTNTASMQPSHVLNPATMRWQPLAGAHGGSVIGASVHAGQVTGIEVSVPDSGAPQLHAGNVSAPLPADALWGAQPSSWQDVTMLWTRDGAIVAQINQAGKVVPFSRQLQPNKAGAWPRSGDSANLNDTPATIRPSVSPDAASAILPNGLLYQAGPNTVSTGAWISQDGSQAGQSYTMVTSHRDQVYATGSGADTTSRTSAFTSRNATLTRQALADTVAPALVLPNGDAVAVSDDAYVLLPRQR